MEKVDIGSHKYQSNKKYLEVKKKNSERAIYQAKRKAERKRFGDVIRRDDQKGDVFKI